MATVYAVLAAITVFPHIVHSAEPARVTYDRLDGIQHNTTALHDIRAPAWVNNAELRGTASILFSCILTLFACIYKALHLNIPNEGAGFFWQLIGKVKWMLIALFAPEMTVWVALDQFLTAWELSRYLTAKDEQRCSEACEAERPDPAENHGILDPSEAAGMQHKNPAMVSADLLVGSEDDGVHFLPSSSYLNVILSEVIY